jgi:hypothetical protein
VKSNIAEGEVMNHTAINSFFSTHQTVTVEQYIPRDARELNEEQLFIALVSKQLGQQPGGVKLVQSFQSHVASLVEQSKTSQKHMQLEDAGQKAIQMMLERKELSKAGAEKLIRTAWTAAQLDDNPALWDSISGPNDPTKAVATRDAALKGIQAKLDAIAAGKLSLIDPQRIAPSATPHAMQGARVASGATTAFLWKPVANSSGTGSVLFPAQLGKEATAVVIQDASGNTIDKGRFTSFGDDGARAKYVFTRAGKEYPANSVVVITLRSGEQIRMPLADPAKRLEKNALNAQ